MRNEIIIPMLESLSSEERHMILRWRAMIKQLLSTKYVDLFLREQKNRLGPTEKRMLKETLNQFRKYLIEESFAVLCQRILILHDNRRQELLKKEIIDDFKNN